MFTNLTSSRWANEIPIWIYDQSDAKWVDFFTYLKLACLPICNDTILIIKIDQVFKKKKL